MARKSMNYDAQELQNCLLNILKAFHELCEANNLKYYIIGGTCLGAARHQGFIPWDDDIDVGMPREDYNRLCSLPKESFPTNLELRYYFNTPNSPFHFVKLVDNTTTLIEKSYLNYVEGLFLDVFPIDGIDDYKKKSGKLRANKIWFYKVLIYYHWMTDKKRGFAKNILIRLAKSIPVELIHHHVDQLMTKYPYESSSTVCNFFGAWKNKEIYPKEFLGQPTLYKFEDTQLFGPEKIDLYLKHVYGNYLELPPVEERVFRHNYYYIDLDNSFYGYSFENDS